MRGPGELGIRDRRRLVSSDHRFAWMMEWFHASPFFIFFFLFDLMIFLTTQKRGKGKMSLTAAQLADVTNFRVPTRKARPSVPPASYGGPGNGFNATGGGGGGQLQDTIAKSGM